MTAPAEISHIDNSYHLHWHEDNQAFPKIVNFQIRHGAEIAKAQQKEEYPDQVFTFDS